MDLVRLQDFSIGLKLLLNQVNLCDISVLDTAYLYIDTRVYNFTNVQTFRVMCQESLGIGKFVRRRGSFVEISLNPNLLTRYQGNFTLKSVGVRYEDKGKQDYALYMKGFTPSNPYHSHRIPPYDIFISCIDRGLEGTGWYLTHNKLFNASDPLNFESKL